MPRDGNIFFMTFNLDWFWSYLGQSIHNTIYTRYQLIMLYSQLHHTGHKVTRKTTHRTDYCCCNAINTSYSINLNIQLNGIQETYITSQGTPSLCLVQSTREIQRSSHLINPVTLTQTCSVSPCWLIADSSHPSWKVKQIPNQVSAGSRHAVSVIHRLQAWSG